MDLHKAIGILGKYIYFKEGEEPSADDIRQSEILEGRLREGFVRIRQLTVSGYHSKPSLNTSLGGSMIDNSSRQ